MIQRDDVEDQISVFVSYDRRETVLVHILTAHLESLGCRCLIDSSMIGTGEDFQDVIRSAIRDCEVVLVVLTEHSASSAWVHQEIGFALALGKPVLPFDFGDGRQSLDMGMAASLHRRPFKESQKVDENFANVAEALRQQAMKQRQGLGVELNQVIEGQIKRTQFIIGRIGKLLAAECTAQLLIQAPFSSFSISLHDAYSRTNDPKLVQMLQQEREMFDKLVKRGTPVKMMVWPFRDTREEECDRQSLKTLFHWMVNQQHNPRVRYVCAQFDGPNRLILSTEGRAVPSVLIDGYKHGFTAGYTLSIVKHQSNVIETAKHDFNYSFDAVSAGQATNGVAIDVLVTEARKRYPDFPDTGFGETA